MKCPKCLYIGFETGDRCKNCGYDFSLLGMASFEQESPPHRIRAGSRGFLAGRLASRNHSLTTPSLVAIQCPKITPQGRDDSARKPAQLGEATEFLSDHSNSNRDPDRDQEVDEG